MSATIKLADSELEKCIGFAKNSAANQQPVEYGQHDTAERSVGEIARDNLIGKIGEVAFKNFIGHRYSINIDLDFNCYDRGVYDEEDADINGWKIDVKGTVWGRWMLIEWNKLNFRQKENKLSHIYVMTKPGFIKNEPTGYVDIIGYAFLYDLQPGKSITQVLRKKDFIPRTQTKLQADNYGIHFNNLRKN